MKRSLEHWEALRKEWCHHGSDLWVAKGLQSLILLPMQLHRLLSEAQANFPISRVEFSQPPSKEICHHQSALPSLMPTLGKWTSLLTTTWNCQYHKHNKCASSWFLRRPSKKQSRWCFGTKFGFGNGWLVLDKCTERNVKPSNSWLWGLPHFWVDGAVAAYLIAIGHYSLKFPTWARQHLAISSRVRIALLMMAVFRYGTVAS